MDNLQTVQFSSPEGTQEPQSRSRRRRHGDHSDGNFTDQSAIPYATASTETNSSRRYILKQDNNFSPCTFQQPRKGLRGPGCPVVDQVFLGRVPEFPVTKSTVTYWSGAGEVYAVTACRAYNTPKHPLLEGQPIPGEDVNDLRLVTPALWSASAKEIIYDGNELYHA